MNRLISVLMAAALVSVVAAAAWAAEVPPAPNGIAFPADYKDWRLIAVSHRTDNNTLRAILGNDAAIEAARKGETNPWPDGAVLAKIVLKDATDPHWAAATVPGKYVHVEFMVKDGERFADTGGWGFARWLGEDRTPYGDNAEFVQECFGCHTPVKDNDYVFTKPVILP